MDQEQLKRALEDHAAMMATLEIGDLARGLTEQRGYVQGWVTEFSKHVITGRDMVRIESERGSFNLWADEVTLVQKARRR